MTNWDRWIEQQIQKAIEDGAFENLPGQGKPLNLEEDVFLDPDWRVAYRLLRSNGFSLPWIENRKDIEQQIKTAREGLKRAWDWHQEQEDAGVDPASLKLEWARFIGIFRQQVDAVNRQITDYNLEAPALSLQLVALDPEREIAAVSQSRPASGLA
jgi:DnaJ family protein C protein 28